MEVERSVVGLYSDEIPLPHLKKVVGLYSDEIPLPHLKKVVGLYSDEIPLPHLKKVVGLYSDEIPLPHLIVTFQCLGPKNYQFNKLKVCEPETLISQVRHKGISKKTLVEESDYSSD